MLDLSVRLHLLWVEHENTDQQMLSDCNKVSLVYSQCIWNTRKTWQKENIHRQRRSWNDDKKLMLQVIQVNLVRKTNPSLIAGDRCCQASHPLLFNDRGDENTCIVGIPTRKQHLFLQTNTRNACRREGFQNKSVSKQEEDGRQQLKEVKWG